MSVLLLLGALSAYAEPEVNSSALTIELSQARLLIQGAISSAGHEQILRQTAARLFPQHESELVLQVEPGLPPTWSLITDQTLRTLAHTQSAAAKISPGKVILRGFASDPAAWFAALTRLETLLAPGIVVESAISPFHIEQSFTSLCQQLFATAVRARTIEFADGIKTLSSSAYGLLDELAELATDCPSAIVRITGNGDGSASNQRDGLQRAEAVAAYLKGRGFNPSRIRSAGAEISLNRRIEFSFSF